MEEMDIHPRQLSEESEESEVDMLKDDLSTFNINPIGIQLVNNMNELSIQAQTSAHIEQQLESTLNNNNQTTITINGKNQFTALFSITNHIEIFANICSYLEPLDLVLLRLTCKYFNNLVNSPFDSITQQIWKHSRIESCEFYQLPPPLGISEQLYISMIYTDSGEKALRDEWELPVAIIKILIPITIQDLYGDYLRYYWTPSVSFIIEELINLKPDEEKYWLKSKEIEYQFAIMTSLEREYWERCRYIKKYYPTGIETRKRKSIESKEEQPSSLDNSNQQSEISLYPTYYDWLTQLDILPIYKSEYTNALEAAAVNDEIINQKINQAKYEKLSRTIIEDNSVYQRSYRKIKPNYREEDIQQLPRFRNAGYSLRARAPKSSSSSSLNNI
ncbi:7488_t:CDS:2 [Ambispora gerdemannii]|uniref:7488_t:CDS:1 n=1 Tax=Ambispora gerdemannii TaxID=144530 RepID=A0A9N9D4V7_9GLOM|nr:7488_t:CDS:2 [Ambispora gerdemannii]